MYMYLYVLKGVGRWESVVTVREVYAMGIGVYWCRIVDMELCVIINSFEGISWVYTCTLIFIILAFLYR